MAKKKEERRHEPLEKTPVWGQVLDAVAAGEGMVSIARRLTLPIGQLAGALKRESVARKAIRNEAAESARAAEAAAAAAAAENRKSEPKAKKAPKAEKVPKAGRERKLPEPLGDHPLDAFRQQMVDLPDFAVAKMAGVSQASIREYRHRAGLKKKAGRPSMSALAHIASMSADAPAAPVVEKRKPGRPRKVVEAAPLVAAAAASAASAQAPADAAAPKAASGARWAWRVTVATKGGTQSRVTIGESAADAVGSAASMGEVIGVERLDRMV